MNTRGPNWTPLFSPHARISQVPLDQVLDSVHYLMFRWGFIGEFRADNGSPFGDPSRQALSDLNLHLIALGIRVKLNPPRSPIKNAKVERNQGTTARWADPKTCADYLDLQTKLNQAVEDQRDNYATRTCAGMTRAEKYPQLFCNPKQFHPADFEVSRVFKQLGKGTWERKVSAQGAVTLFTQSYQVGHKHKNTTVTASFCPLNQNWVFKNRKGDILQTCPAKYLLEKFNFSFSTCQ